MDRITTDLSMKRATFGRCSLMRTPGAEVAISLYGPPLEVPGFKSKVSIWLGPPVIHRRMHERRRCGLAAVSAANASNQPEAEQPATPAAARRSQSRRDSSGRLRLRDV